MFPRLPRQHGSNSDPGAASAWSPRSPHVRFWIDQPNLEVGAPLITRSIAFFWGSYISSYDSYVYMSGYEWIWHIHVDLWWVYINNIYIYYIYVYVYMYIYVYICIYIYVYWCIIILKEKNMRFSICPCYWCFFLTIDSRMTIQDAPTGDSTEKD